MYSIIQHIYIFPEDLALDEAMKDKLKVCIAIEIYQGVNKMVKYIRECVLTVQKIDNIYSEAEFRIHNISQAVNQVLWNIRGFHQSNPCLQKMKKL